MESEKAMGGTRRNVGEKVKVKERAWNKKCTSPVVVCVLFISVTCSTDTDTKTIVKCWYDVHMTSSWYDVSGRFLHTLP